MTIQLGSLMPNGTLTQVSKEGPETIATDEFFKSKKVVLFGLPGAFTPTCSEAHLPGFVTYFEQLKSKSIDTVACITVNDHFVVAAWMEKLGIRDIVMLSDGNAEYVSALGMNVDMTARGFGMRSARFALVAENANITYVARENTPKDHGVSSAEEVFKFLS